MQRTGTILKAAVLVTLVSAMGAGFNSPIRIEDGAVHEGDLSALNGKIEIGDGATVRGSCESVNGPVSVGSNARVEEVSSVNGGIRVGEGTVIENEVSAVNGPISMERGSRAASVATINGPIKLKQVEIDGDVRTINGNVALLDRTTVAGNIVVEERGGSGHRDRSQRIEIEGGSVVEGDVIVEDPEVRVKVYLRDGSRIMGRVENAELIEE